VSLTSALRDVSQIATLKLELCARELKAKSSENAADSAKTVR